MDTSGASWPPPDSTDLSSHATPDLEPFDPITSSSSTKQYRRKPTEKRRTQTSFIWKNMPGLIGTIYQQEGSEAIYWRCKYCPKEYRESGGTAFIAVICRLYMRLLIARSNKTGCSNWVSLLQWHEGLKRNTTTLSWLSSINHNQSINSCAALCLVDITLFGLFQHSRDPWAQKPPCVP